MSYGKEKKIIGKHDRYVINHTGSSLSAAAAFPTTAHIIPVSRNKKHGQYEVIRVLSDREGLYNIVPA